MIITILAVLQFMGAAIWLVGVFIVIGSIAAGRGGPRLIVIIGFALGGIGLLQALCGLGLWSLKGYGRTLQLVFAWIGLIGFPIGTLISILILVYLFKPGVKALFSDKPASELTAGELTQIAALHQGSQATVVIIVIAIAAIVAVPVLGIVAAIAIPALLRARITANEVSAISAIRTFVSAETAYAAVNGGFFDTPQCLASPVQCLPAYSGPALLDARLDSQSARRGYRFQFVAGPAPDLQAVGSRGFSKSSLTGFSYIAVPTGSGSTGIRSFCADSGGRICSMREGAAQPLGGVCPATCQTLP